MDLTFGDQDKKERISAGQQFLFDFGFPAFRGYPLKDCFLQGLDPGAHFLAVADICPELHDPGSWNK